MFSQMSATHQIVGFVRESDKHTLDAQRAAMKRARVDKTYTNLDLCIRQRRRNLGDVIAVHRAMLLADPADKRKLGGLRGSFRRNLDRLEAAGAVLLELDTGLTSLKRRDRDAMVRAAEDELGRIRRYSRTGRPNRVWGKDELAVMRLHWFSREHLTNKAAVAAMHADGVRVSMSQVYRALGKSNRELGPKT
jgi:hypothetical protein